MTSILVPLDGSACAERVVPYVRMLAPLLGAHVTLLQALDTDTPEALTAMVDQAAGYADGQMAAERPLPATHAAQPYLPDETRDRARSYLASQAAQLRTAGIQVTTRTAIGPAPDAILAVAEELQSSMIALSTHGRSGVRRWAVGSVTDRLVQATTRPVLVVRGGAHPTGSACVPRRILVPLDGSARSRQAVPFALQLAETTGAELVLLTAVVPLFAEYAMLPAIPVEIQTGLSAAIEQELNEFAADLRRQYARVTAVVLDGFAAETILDEAAHRDVDMIVMATHGRGGLRRWALGSVADRVLHAAAVPLVMVRVVTNGQHAPQH